MHSLDMVHGDLKGVSVNDVILYLLIDVRPASSLMLLAALASIALISSLPPRI